MKKKSLVLAFCLAFSLTATPTLAAEDPAEVPAVDWDTAAAIGYDYSIVDEDGVEPIPEPQANAPKGIVVDLKQYQGGNLTYTLNGVEMVPLRLVAENMGYTVDWNEETQSATINGGDFTYTVRIGEDTLVNNANGNVIVDYELLNTNGEEGQEDTAVYTVTTDSNTYTITTDSNAAADVAYTPADGEEKSETANDENCGIYADGAEYTTYEVNTADGGICGVSELAICPAYTIGGYNDEAAPESKLAAAQPAKGFGAAAQLIDGKTFVPASMFRVLNYNYDQAGKTFTIGKLNVQEAGAANGVGQYVITLAD